MKILKNGELLSGITKKNIYLGYFDNPFIAAYVAAKKRLELFGEFKGVNEPFDPMFLIDPLIDVQAIDREEYLMRYLDRKEAA